MKKRSLISIILSMSILNSCNFTKNEFIDFSCIKYPNTLRSIEIISESSDGNFLRIYTLKKNSNTIQVGYSVGENFIDGTTNKTFYLDKTKECVYLVPIQNK